ncbi:MAG: two-component system, sensor histidine kinase and response regulator [Chloroflexota bacterium]|nr:two-component system, sensor histidine kinase and response regulator [Chloroflexota bacterium]
MGLAISKRIVQLMQGEISVTSEAGRGSTFSFVVPFNKLPPKKHLEMFLLKEVVNKKVLIVDSNMKSSQWLTRLLKPTQAEITQVGDLDTLQELLDPERNEKPFDVVLVNNNVTGFRRMSDMAGIKQHFPAGDIKVVHLTDTVQFAQQSEDIKGKSVDAILIKPINASQLYDTWLRLFASDKDLEEIGRQTQDQDVHSKPLRNLNILLVEDNEINQDVIGELLRQNGAAVEIAANGKEAVAKTKEQRFNLVLMDVQMPVMDGFKATSEIRKDERFANLPIIALTANAQTEEKRQAEAAGMNDYITKPIEPKLLFSAIAHWMQKNYTDMQTLSDAETPELEISGLDTESALRRLNNEVPAYLKLLQKFIRNHGPDWQELTAQLEQQDWNALRSKAHGMRGAALNLGAEELGKSLTQVEKAAREKDAAKVKRNLTAAGKKYKTVEQGIEKALQQQTTAPQTKKQQLDLKDLEKQLNELLQKVQENDPIAKNRMNEINQVVAADQFEGTLIKAQLALDAYNFRKAESEIARAIKLLKGAGENG